MSALGQVFVTLDGPARAYFEIRRGSDEDPVRIDYATVALKAPGDDENTQAQLCLQFYNGLAALLTEEQQEDHDVILFWRRRPIFHVAVDTEGRPFTALSARLAIPGFALPKDFFRPEVPPKLSEVPVV